MGFVLKNADYFANEAPVSQASGSPAIIRRQNGDTPSSWPRLKTLPYLDSLYGELQYKCRLCFGFSTENAEMVWSFPWRNDEFVLKHGIWLKFEVSSSGVRAHTVNCDWNERVIPMGIRYLELQHEWPLLNAKSSIFRGNSPLLLHFHWKQSKQFGIYIAVRLPALRHGPHTAALISLICGII